MTTQRHPGADLSHDGAERVQGEGRGEIGAHIAVWNGYGWQLDCNEGPDAQCRARFTCDCEAFSQYEVHDGKPVHLAYDSEHDTDRWHVGEFLPTWWCNIAEWWDEGSAWEQEGFNGKVRVPVSVEWTFDGPEFTAKPDERDDLAARLAEAEAALSAGEASDGYHTHRELYEYRMLYNAHAAHGWLAAGVPVVKSWHHSDGEPCFGGGWFVVVATLPTGQVSNHYEAEFWDLFNVPEVSLPPDYDGHTPQDAADRLRRALDGPR